jgi:hypothetical protein
MALDCCGPAETTRIALDIGVSETDFRALPAGRWPGSSDSCLSGCTRSIDPAKCSRRADVTRFAKSVQPVRRPAKMRHDLASDPSAPAWREYCPNAPTFAALKSEHSNGRSRAMMAYLKTLEP